MSSACGSPHTHTRRPDASDSSRESLPARRMLLALRAARGWADVAVGLRGCRLSAQRDTEGAGACVLRAEWQQRHGARAA
eukprot:347947-Chlamydomonas_euryale.AAC.10